MATVTRRDLLRSFPALGLFATRSPGSTVGTQGGSVPLRVRSINHVGIAVSDPKRSVEFYQGLFGLPIQAKSGTTTMLRVGAGPQFLAIEPIAAGASPSITHFGLGLDGFNVSRVLTALTQKGVKGSDTTGPMQARVMKPYGSDVIAFGDPDGMVCQLQDVTYCGGSGPLGNRCVVETAPAKGRISLTDLNHLTTFTPDAARTNQFYRDLFSFSIRSYQGPTAPTLAVGPSTQFLMFTGGGAGRGGAGAVARPASINHACFTLDRFNPDEILKTLEQFGLKARESAGGAAGPLRHYVTMRMENRGGAPGGTPEVYFTDPDGLLMQLQDTSYCGGSGVLGNDCRQ